VHDVLRELGAADKPRVTALNKVDLLPDPTAVDVSLFPNAVVVSAVTRHGLEALLAQVGAVVAAAMVPVEVHIPFARADLVELFYRRGHVERDTPCEDGTRLAGALPRPLLATFGPFRYPPSVSRRTARRAEAARAE
jgi:GTP-binding protein HflX